MSPASPSASGAYGCVAEKVRFQGLPEKVRGRAGRRLSSRGGTFQYQVDEFRVACTFIPGFFDRLLELPGKEAGTEP